MTLDQLRVFVAVAEREHLTEGALRLNLSPSAATAAIQALEARHGAKLFNRVGRRLELSQTGRAFLPEARMVLNAAKAAETALQELGGLGRGSLTVAASQTLASHWLPPLLMRFATAHQGIALSLKEGNTANVAALVLAGEAEIGCVEGDVDDPSLAITSLADDHLVVVAAHAHPLTLQKNVQASRLAASHWVMREQGSGTRAVLEAALRKAGIRPDHVSIALSLPTNEAVCAAIADSDCVTAVSELVALPYIQAGRLRRIDYTLPPRRFAMLRHKERFRTKAMLAFEDLLRREAERMTQGRLQADYCI